MSSAARPSALIQARGPAARVTRGVVATLASVPVAELPGHSRRIGPSNEMMPRDGRTRAFRGRPELWPVEPMDDAAEAAAGMTRRLGV